MKQTCFLLATLLAALPAAHAATLSLYQGADLSAYGLGTYAGVSNLTLIEGVNGNNFSSRNYGGNGSLTIGRDNTAGERRGLLRFDLSELDGVIGNITSATLTVTLLNLSNSNATNIAFSAYEVAAANAGWVQGTSTGGAQTGAGSWSFKSITTTPWAGSGGLHTAGTDYIDSIIDGSKTGKGGISGVTGTQVTWTLSREMIEAWMSGGDNAGLLFAADNIAGLATSDFFSMAVSSNTNVAYRPTLTINYEAIPEPGTVALLIGSAALLGLMRRERRSKA